MRETHVDEVQQVHPYGGRELTEICDEHFDPATLPNSPKAVGEYEDGRLYGENEADPLVVLLVYYFRVFLLVSDSRIGL